MCAFLTNVGLAAVLFNLTGCTLLGIVASSTVVDRPLDDSGVPPQSGRRVLVETVGGDRIVGRFGSFSSPSLEEYAQAWDDSASAHPEWNDCVRPLDRVAIRSAMSAGVTVTSMRGLSAFGDAKLFFSDSLGRTRYWLPLSSVAGVSRAGEKEECSGPELARLVESGALPSLTRLNLDVPGGQVSFPAHEVRMAIRHRTTVGRLVPILLGLTADILIIKAFRDTFTLWGGSLFEGDF